MNETQTDYTELLEGIGQKAKAAARELAVASTDAKNQALLKSAEAIRRGQNHLLSENAKDMAAAVAASRITGPWGGFSSPGLGPEPHPFIIGRPTTARSMPPAMPAWHR